MKYPIDIHIFYFEILEEQPEKEFCACDEGKCTGKPGAGRTCGASFDFVKAMNDAAAKGEKTKEGKLLTKRFGARKGTQPEIEN